MKQSIHQGQVVKRIIQSKGYSIAEFAKLTNINRRFVFILFDRSNLGPQIIKTISKVIDYDFNAEFSDPPPES